MSGILPATYVPGFHDEQKVKKMAYNDFGNTGLKVSTIAFGSAVFSDLYNVVDLEKCRQTLTHALKSGINYIDTAPYYGQGVAEEVLGEILQGIPRQAYYIATKVGRYEKDVKFLFDFSAKKTKQSIDLSLKRLKLDSVDVLQIHDVDFAPSLDMILNETLPAVQEIVNSGKAKFIGVTGYPVNHLARVVESSKIKLDLVLCYARLTMFDDSLKQFLPFFKKHNVAVINASPHAQALLTNRGEQSWHIASKHIKDVCAEARKLCVQNNVELGKLAAWHSLQQKGPATTLIGMDSVKVVDFTLEVLHNGLNADEHRVYKQVLRIFETTLKEKHWEGIDIEQYLELLKNVS